LLKAKFELNPSGTLQNNYANANRMARNNSERLNQESLNPSFLTAWIVSSNKQVVSRRKIVFLILITPIIVLLIPYLLGQLTVSSLSTWIPIIISFIIISLVFVFALPKLMEEQMKDLEDQAGREGRA
jgi:hypothetical protein